MAGRCVSPARQTGYFISFLWRIKGKISLLVTFNATIHELKTDIVKSERESEKEMDDWKNLSDDNNNIAVLEV